MAVLNVAAVREQFPALSRQHDGRPAVFFDGPAGSQVPRTVIDAIGDYLRQHNANHGGVFATSVENDELLLHAQRAAADFLGTSDPQSIVFGANMTTVTFAFSRALAQTWQPGDEIIVTDLDHDANVTPWVLAARDRGVTVKHVAVRPEDCTLDLEDLDSKLNSHTRLIAVGAASNAVGTINPIMDIVKERVRKAPRAEIFLDAVHYAPHGWISQAAQGCDYVVCSAYKFFGPHIGILWGRRDRLEELTPYKVRPSSDDCPDRWMTGTPNFECIAGVRAAIQYIADLGIGNNRQAQLRSAFARIGVYERELGLQLLHGLTELPCVRVLGITDPARFDGRFPERVPTFSIVHQRYPAKAVAEHLAQRGIFVWHGNFYALRLSEMLGTEPAGMVRIGLLHYNTADEVARLLAALRELP
ncbi:MAG: cysteine desulfurase-like protein [Gemmataceae bacterium]